MSTINLSSCTLMQKLLESSALMDRVNMLSRMAAV
jgi:hypothetical protein